MKSAIDEKSSAVFGCFGAYALKHGCDPDKDHNAEHPKPTSLNFYGPTPDQQLVLSISFDEGKAKITVPDGVEINAAAQAVFDALLPMLKQLQPSWERSARSPNSPASSTRRATGMVSPSIRLRRRTAPTSA
jgi:hypothetical protein